MDDNYIDGVDEEWARYNWFPPVEPEAPPPAAPYNFLMDPNWSPTSSWEEEGRIRNLHPNSEWVWSDQYGWQVKPKNLGANTTPMITTTGGGGDYGGGDYFSGLQPPSRMPLSALNYPQFQGPRFTPPKPFEFEPFKAPTLAEAQAEPGFDYALQQGLKAMENSKAYLGTYRTGGTIKALNDYARNMANQNYGQVYSRAADTYDRNRNNAASNYATNYGISRDVFDRDYQGAKDTHASNARGRELEFAREWDQFAYEGDDAFRRWKAIVDANTP